jgi:hypothetical protein
LSKKTDDINQKLDLRKLKVAKEATFDSYKNQHDECLPGTRRELLHQIEEWAKSPHGKCIFWLNGMAGTGKSTISRTIASKLKLRNSLGASFFFKRGEEDRGSAKKLFPTLVQQLVTTIPQLINGVQKAIKDDPYISEKALGEQFNKLLLQPLINVDLDQTATMVIVIDALDECESGQYGDDVKAILKLLPQVQMLKAIQLRFFLTSRPELPIRLGLQKIIGNHQDLDLHAVPQSEVARDIASFLKHKMSHICQDHGLPIAWPGDEVIQILITRTLPLFISAATLCRFIGDPHWYPPSRLKVILDYQSAYVSKMDNTYLPVLNQLLLGADKWESQELVQEFKRIIGAIIILTTPLSVNALSQLLKTETINIVKQLHHLHSVLNFPDDFNAPVRLFHLSFRDFLLDSKTKETKFWIDEKIVHQNLTDQCLEIMDRNLKQNICNLPTDVTQRDEIDQHSINHHLPSELQYACRYWIQHLIKSENPLAGLAKAFSFLKVHLLHWVETVSILGIISEVVGTFKILQSVIQVS